MTFRFINIDRDYPKLEAWWKTRKFPPANPKFMPPTGLMVSLHGVDIVAGFLFKSDANAAIIGNIVSNPDVTWKDRLRCIDNLLIQLIELARVDGFGMVCCSTNLPRLQERFKTHGFILTDEGVANFGRVL